MASCFLAWKTLHRKTKICEKNINSNFLKKTFPFFDFNFVFLDVKIFTLECVPFNLYFIFFSNYLKMQDLVLTAIIFGLVSVFRIHKVQNFSPISREYIWAELDKKSGQIQLIKQIKKKSNGQQGFLTLTI